MHKLITIAKNTFVETLRQPIYAIIVVAAMLLFLLSPSIAMYTMDDDNKLLREIGLSTLFLTSLFVAIFSASGAVATELESKTIMTVLTKPVQRPIFILAKFLGVVAAVALAHYLCTIALLMAIRHGVLQSAGDAHDWTVLASAGGVVLLSLLLGAFCNYTYDWKFSSTAIVSAAILATGATIFLALIDRHWQFNPAANGINRLDVAGSVLLFLAAVIIAALAVALSARFNTVVTLSACIGVFLLGLISDYVFGLVQAHTWAQVGRALVPNLQIFWISDAIYEGSVVPLKYILISGVYTVCYAGAILAVAIALFQKRQVG